MARRATSRPTRRRLRLLLVAAVLGPVLVLVAGIAVRERGGGADMATAAPAPVQAGELTGAPDDLADAVATLQARLGEFPNDFQSWASLGFAYVAQARATGDPSLYPRAEQAFDRSLEERTEDNSAALAGQALLANARHDFAAARESALAAEAVDPYDATAKGLLADAQFELGQYDEGRETLQEMVDLRPGVPSLTRVSYSFELRGDFDGARYALDRALDIATAPSDRAFSLGLLAGLAWGEGDYDQAALLVADGLKQSPDDVQLQVWRARIAAARGYSDAALRHYEQVVQRQPEAVVLVEYGELLQSLGREDEAQAQYDVAEASALLAKDAGVLPDVEVVLFQADHGDPVEALRLARAQYEERRSVQVEDALAWALYANGLHEEALVHAEAAQQLGTRSAMWDYHRGMIQAELGMVAEARESLQGALDLNPAFSPLHAERARQALAALPPA